jgi:adenine-specific DNA-methyltransferase
MYKAAIDRHARLPRGAELYPRLRYMGNKHRLLPWLHETFAGLPFASALDLFSGSGSVAYLLKTMGKRVIASDFLQFAHLLAVAAVENSSRQVSPGEFDSLCGDNPRRRTFIERTFENIFFTADDLRFLDTISANVEGLTDPHAKAVVSASLTRACMKRQPRGVFTVSGRNYDDGRRDLRLSLREHFRESLTVFNGLVFENGYRNIARRADALEVEAGEADLVYMDPPYVPRADDNCYVKRYHFLEGLASYWTAPGTEIEGRSRVRKIPKRYTPFSYRRSAVDAFECLFRRHAESILVLSYSSNGFPDLATLVALMRRYKPQVEVLQRQHRYHFGTHRRASEARNVVSEYLIVGTA